ncbi:uncharacterized protein LOC135392437 [Ornithodoros turicata]|uniref:uncharacterized protein LOC135392437 n=1 Tax=Ornithodoros turicata TaxID=34597 RepID=UPI00313927FA
MRHLSALVALDIAKAYDSVIHAVLLQRLLDTATPPYLLTWIANFLSGRTSFCSDGRFVSSAYPRSRGVPQGSVLSPILFNILMSSLPCDPEVLTITYADDIAFFASAPSLPELYAKLQAYMNTLSTWLDSIHLSLNVAQSAILVFPLDVAISIDLRVGLQSVRQVTQLKYLGVWYDETLCWSQHIDHLSAKAPKALSVLHRCCSPRIVGPRRDAPLVQVSEIFHADAKRLPLMTLQRTLTDHLNRYAQYLIVATDASLSEERAEAGLFFPQLCFQFPVRLPDFTPPFDSEFLTMALALRRVPPAFEQVLLQSDSLSLISALASPTGFLSSSESLASILVRLATPHLRKAIITWFPGYRGLTLNETADTLATMSLSG